MINAHVNINLGRALKEKGFWGVWALYNILTGEKWHTYFLGNKEYEENYPAPKISEVISWLYEKHKIWLMVDIEGEDFDSFFFMAYRNHDERVAAVVRRVNGQTNPRNYKSPTEAYEAGILYCLENLIK